MCQQNVPNASVDPVTHQLGGDQTIHWESGELCHALTLLPCEYISPILPSLEGAKEERERWKDLTCIQKKMHHRKIHLKEKRQ